MNSKPLNARPLSKRNFWKEMSLFWRKSGPEKATETQTKDIASPRDLPITKAMVQQRKQGKYQ